jgi:cytochrome P450
VNVYATARREGLAADEAAERTSGLDAYAIVPTNFVMRACVGADTLGGEAVEPGDVVYLFLGSASGCPFSRLTSLPFGAGSHYCSGAALTRVMMKSVRSVLGRMRADCSRVSPTPEVEGKASAFLVFATER